MQFIYIRVNFCWYLYIKCRIAILTILIIVLGLFTHVNNIEMQWNWNVIIKTFFLFAVSGIGLLYNRKISNYLLNFVILIFNKYLQFLQYLQYIYYIGSLRSHHFHMEVYFILWSKRNEKNAVTRLWKQVVIPCKNVCTIRSLNLTSTNDNLRFIEMKAIKIRFFFSLFLLHARSSSISVAAYVKSWIKFYNSLYRSR